MDEKVLINEINKIIKKYYQDIYVLDILNDKVYSFIYNKDDLEISSVISFIEFVDKMKPNILADDVNNYFDSFSLNQLEMDAKKGIFEHKFSYQRLSDTGDYHQFLRIINYVEINNHKLIFMMSEDITDRLIESEKETLELQVKIDNYQKKIQDETDSISDAILKINNVLDNNIFNTNMNNAKDYINSIFSRVSIDHPELNKAIIDKISNETNYRKPSILIVDDSSIIRNSLKKIFVNDFNIIFAKDGKEAINIINENLLNKDPSTLKENIVGILLDLIMPIMDGFAVLDYLKDNNMFNRIPVCIISGDETRETRKRVYEYDIVDMLEKPFNTVNIHRRISKIINLYISGNNLQSIVDIQNIELNNNKSINYKNLEEIISSIVNNILNTNESKKIKLLAHLFALNIYKEDPKMVDQITQMSPLYNIGAIALNDDTLITKDSILKEIDYGLSIADIIVDDKDYLNTLYDIIKYSCELYDGTGYPNNISKDEIPLSASITSIVIRLIQYTKIHKFKVAYKMILENEKSKYNPLLINILINNKKEIENILK